MAEENVLEKAESYMHKQPWYVWAGLLAGGGVVTWYVLKSRASKAAATSSNGASAANANLTNGYDVASLAGIPYGYITGYTSNGGPTDNYPQPPPPTTTPPTTTTTTETGMIRSKNPAQKYDQGHTGVPVHNVPDGSGIIGQAAWGSTVTITGDPVTGGNNGTGVMLWFPVTYNGHPGYISVADIVNIIKGTATPTRPIEVPNSGTGSGGPPSDWESGLNMHRNTVDQYHFALIGGGGDGQLV